MNSRKLVYIITLALILFNLFYRISPALTNAPVFSLDAWSLLTDVKYMLENGKGSLVSCNSLPSCYFGYWPSPIVITTITSQITNLNIYWAPVVVTFFMNTLFIFALLLIIYRIILNKLRAFFFGSLIISSLWFTNIFYSGFKAEMIAMPLLMVLILLLIRFEEGNSRETKLIPLILYIFLIIVFTHHFTTYIAMASIGGYFVYKHVQNKLASSNDIGAVGGRPIPLNNPKTLCGWISHLIWDVHHEICLREPKLSGELCALRSHIVYDAPSTIINDDAYLQLIITMRGYKVAYEPGAIVYLREPENLRDLFRQRYRVTIGHYQVEQLLGAKLPTPYARRNIRIAWKIRKRVGLIKEVFRFTFFIMFSIVVVLKVLFDFYIRRKLPYKWELVESTKKVSTYSFYIKRTNFHYK